MAKIVLPPPPSVAQALKQDVALAPYAAYGLGGPADLFFEPHDEAALIAGLEWAHAQGLPLFVLGSGTNLLVRDGGIRGVVIYLGPHARSWALQVLEDNADFERVRVPAAFSKARLLEWALSQQLEGLEFSAGIPGTLGGAVYMNAGTRWGAYAQVIERVRLWMPGEGVCEKSSAEMGFKYRGHGEGVLSKGAVVLSADLYLRRSHDIERSRALVDRILSYRGSRQALERPSCGSVFKNPPNSARGAGRLIESAGLKGLRRGGAQISTKHANFLLNRAATTAADVEELIRLAQKCVQEEFGILLEPEVIFAGEAELRSEEAFRLK